MCHLFVLVIIASVDDYHTSIRLAKCKGRNKANWGAVLMEESSPGTPGIQRPNLWKIKACPPAVSVQDSYFLTALWSAKELKTSVWGNPSCSPWLPLLSSNSSFM